MASPVRRPCRAESLPDEPGLPDAHPVALRRSETAATSFPLHLPPRGIEEAFGVDGNVQPRPSRADVAGVHAPRPCSSLLRHGAAVGGGLVAQHR